MPPTAARDDRAALPHGLGDGESEALGEALLGDDTGVALERVDDHRGFVGVVHRDAREVDAGTHRLGKVAPGPHAFVEHRAGFGVVVDAVHGGPDEREVRIAAVDVIGERRGVHLPCP